MNAQSKTFSERDCGLFNIQSKRKLADRLQVNYKHLLELAKPNGVLYKQYLSKGVSGEKDRWIEEPKPLLKLIQHRILFLISIITPPDYLYSGVKGVNRSAVTNAMQHDPGVPLVQLDVKKFFPTATGSYVYSFFHKKLQCSTDVAAILTHFTTIGPTKNSKFNHLPTGGVTSQLLSFLAYQEMFDEIDRSAARRGNRFTLMVDDMTFSGAKAHQGQLNDARMILKKYALLSHPEKERLFRSHQIKITTGVALTPSGYRVPNSLRKEITDQYLALHIAITPTGKSIIYERLLGKLRSAGQIETRFREQSDKLMKKWKADKAAWAAYITRSQERCKKGKITSARKDFVRHQLQKSPVKINS